MVLKAARVLVFSVTLSALATSALAGPKIPERPLIEQYADYDVPETGPNEENGPLDWLVLPAASPGLSPTVIGAPEVNKTVYANTYRNVQSYIDAIVKIGPRPDITPKIMILSSPRAEAFAPQLDTIVITAGLLDALYPESPTDAEEFASASEAFLLILAHEYAHLLYNHPAEYKAKRRKINPGEVLGSMMSVAKALSPITSMIGGDAAKLNNDAIGGLFAARSLSPVIEAELVRAVYAPYRKEAELMADFMAVDLLVRLDNVNPRAGAEYFYNVDPTYDNTVVGQMNAGLKRLKEQEKTLMEEVSLMAIDSGLSMDPKRFQKQLEARAAKSLITFLGGLLGRRYLKEPNVYYSSDKRADGIKEYYDTFYEDDQEELSDAALAALGIPTGSNFAEAYFDEAAYDHAAREARLLFYQGRYEKAREVLYVVPDRRNAPSAEFHYIDGLLWQQEGDFENAAITFERAITKPEVTFEMFSALSSTYMVMDMPEKAAEALDKAERAFGESKVIISKINLLISQEDLEGATALAQRCSETYPETIGKACLKQIPEDDDEKEFLGVLSV